MPQMTLYAPDITCEHCIATIGKTVATVEEIRDVNFLDDPIMAAGVLPGFYVETIAIAKNGCWPLPLPASDTPRSTCG
mgnify:CR=1 FL=1